MYFYDVEVERLVELLQRFRRELNILNLDFIELFRPCRGEKHFQQELLGFGLGTKGVGPVFMEQDLTSPHQV